MDLRCYTNDEVAKRSESVATRFDIREMIWVLGHEVSYILNHADENAHFHVKSFKQTCYSLSEAILESYVIKGAEDTCQTPLQDRRTSLVLLYERSGGNQPYKG